MDPTQTLLLPAGLPPLLLPAVLPPRNPPPRPVGGPISLLGYRLAKILREILKAILKDPDRVRETWEAWNSTRGEQAPWVSPPVFVPVVRRGFLDLDARGYLHVLFARASYVQLVMAASVAAAAVLFYGLGRRLRRHRAREDDDPRLLPLEVRRNLRVMVMRILPPRARPLPRCFALDGQVRAPPLLPSWQKRAEGSAVAPVGAATRLAAAPMGAGMQPSGTGLVADVQYAAEGRGGVVAAPIYLASPAKSGLNASSAAIQFQSMVQDTKTKFEENRLNFLKAVKKTYKECEGLLKTSYTKFEATHDKFCKDKAAHVQNFKDLFSKFEVEKEKLIVQYELQRKKEKATLSELEQTVSGKIADAEVYLKKMKQGDESIGMVRKSSATSSGP